MYTTNGVGHLPLTLDLALLQSFETHSNSFYSDGGKAFPRNYISYYYEDVVKSNVKFNAPVEIRRKVCVYCRNGERVELFIFVRFFPVSCTNGKRTSRK